MPTCKNCDTSHDAEALVRHERGDLTLVHCPNCEQLLGIYREPGRATPT